LAVDWLANRLRPGSILWARDLDMAGIVVSSVLTVYILVGMHLEERKLVHESGDAYHRYQRRVSMFVPTKWLCLVLEGKER
jgi:protein-S-isoprenylcysteine O-methyltransferase Ste14